MPKRATILIVDDEQSMREVLDIFLKKEGFDTVTACSGEEGLAKLKTTEFDLIISYLYDPDHIFSINIARCTRAQFITGPHRPNDEMTVHATQLYLKPLERLAIFDADPVPRLRMSCAALTHPSANQSV